MGKLIDPSKYQVASVMHCGPNNHDASDCPSRFPACQEPAETFDSFMLRLLTFIPTATVGCDNDGQMVVYTGLMHNDDDTVVPFAEVTADGAS